jgi:hypothetical protein
MPGLPNRHRARHATRSSLERPSRRVALMTPPWALPPCGGLWPPLLRSRDASSMTRAPGKSRNSEPPRLPFTLVCRCFCSAFRELIWSQHRPRTSAYVPRCAGTTARTCAPGNPPFEQARRRKPQVDRNPPRASDRPTTCVASPLREISLARESSRRAPARYPLTHTLARMDQKRARGEETERAASSAASLRC